MSKAPNYAGIARVYELHDDGLGVHEIAGLTGIRVQDVSKWLRNPHRYDPVIDRVAIERAKNGERSVWENLSLFEMREIGQWVDGLHESMTYREWRKFSGLMRQLVGALAWQRVAKTRERDRAAAAA